MIKSAAKLGVPGVIVSFGIDSYDSVKAFTTGEIDVFELAYDLGDSAASVAGSTAGAALAGATIGSVIPGAGTAVGAIAGMGVSVVGGMVGYAIASEAYASAVEMGSEGVEILADKAQEMAASVVESANIEFPDKIEDIKTALNNFAASNKLTVLV